MILTYFAVYIDFHFYAVWRNSLQSILFLLHTKIFMKIDNTKRKQGKYCSTLHFLYHVKFEDNTFNI